MIMSNLSSLPFALGLGGLIATLAILHILRVRHRKVKVVTTLFWQQVVEPAPARSFWGRFRHLYAFLLSALIIGLLFLAFADPKADLSHEEDVFHILLLDSSARMTEGDRFEKATAALLADVRHLPEGHRRVLWVGHESAPILLEHEPAELLEVRLEHMKPQLVPSQMESLLSHLSEIHSGRSVVATIYGDAHISPDLMHTLAADLTVKRALPLPAPMDNIGVSAAGISEAASGQWEAVDLFFKVSGDEEQVKKSSVTVDVDGADMSEAIQALGGGDFMIADVPAKGGLLTISLAGDGGFSADNLVKYRLPVRNKIRVGLSEGVSRQLMPVLQADPAVQLVSEGGDVFLRRQDEAPLQGSQTAEIVFAPMATQDSAFHFRTKDDVDDNAIKRLVEAVGLNQIDAAGLAGESGRPIQVTFEQGDGIGITMWSELLTDQFNFRKSRAFPLLMARALRWVAQTEDWVPYIAAGERLASSTQAGGLALVGMDGREIDTQGQSPRVGPAGAMKVSGIDATQWASLQLLPVEDREEDPLQASIRDTGDSYFASDWFLWLLLAAALLLLAEWRLFQTGRMP